MKNVERNEDLIHLQLETVDKEGTYEQKNGNDLGNKTVFAKGQSNKKIIIKKVEKTENVIFTN